MNKLVALFLVVLALVFSAVAEEQAVDVVYVCNSASSLTAIVAVVLAFVAALF
jgi:hypothetical protein